MSTLTDHLYAGVQCSEAYPVAGASRLSERFRRERAAPQVVAAVGGRFAPMGIA